MKIHSLNGNITIIKKIYDNESFEINLCKKNEIEDKLYTIIVLKDIKLIHNNIQLFSKIRENNKFSDFIDCFSQNSYLYIMFSYYTENSIEFDKVVNFPLLQRVEIAKQILRLIVLLDIPKPILYDVMSDDNINLDSSGKVYFNYFLKNIDRYSAVEEKDGIKRIATIFVKIFPEEITENTVDGFNLLVEQCENATYNNIMSIYSDFSNLNDNFIKSSQRKKEKKDNLIKKIFKKILKMFNKIKGIIILLILCIGVIFLIITYTDNQNKKAVQINQIGTEHFLK